MRPTTNQPEFRFGILRGMLALTIFAATLGCFRTLGTAATAPACVVGCALAMLVLITGRKHTKLLLRTAVCAATGLFFGLMMSPVVPMRGEPSVNTQNIPYMAMGCLICCFLGSLWNRKR